jgi:glyoxylase-like metal-dependent hydrolase (beta-lactamase superfamily II)
VTRIDRRDFLGSALWTAAELPLGCAALSVAAQAVEEPIGNTALTEDITLLTGAGANVLAVKGPAGAVLVDGGLEAHSQELLKAALKVTDARQVQALFNTHWHPEQTGSNEAAGSGRAKIIAHVNTKLWLTRRITVSWREGTYGPLPARALPNETFYSKSTMSLGAEQVDYGYLTQAHTDGDIYVFFRKANVLAAGGVVSANRWPVMDYETGGWIAGLVAGLDTLLKLADDQTKIVPADGPVLTKEDLKAQRTAYFTIYDRLVKCLTKGLSPAEALATEPAKGIKPEWGDAAPFVIASFKSLWGHFAPDA